uniref:Uncharacterized protein n=1 Tax=Candidatus Methanogaster sp. ANME-2c ERB4 TaxID=2759911 RepID=A0A7G9YPB6_9EURY|nr:hypothetical protein HMIKAMFF_00010 [Methanosarcinales archaeon ANME-2c ERB4]
MCAGVLVVVGVGRRYGDIRFESAEQRQLFERFDGYGIFIVHF